jgi:hypothetical protein
MKILYIGNYRDSGSWGRVCRDYLIALIEAGADVVARPILNIAPFVKSLDSRIRKAEDKDSDGAEICVQQLHHPHLLADTRFKKNVAIVGLRNIPNKLEQNQILNQTKPFDDIIAVNPYTQLCTHSLGDVTYQHPIDKTLVKDRLAVSEDRFVFYFIGKLTQRKNLDALLTAFHREFHRDEPVDLLIKTSCDIDPSQAMGIINNHLNQIKSKIGKYPNIEKYKKEMIMLNELIDDNWGVIHNTGNCLVQPSYGEYTDLQTLIALNYGNQAIVNSTPYLSIINDWKVIDVQSMVINVEDSRCSNLTNFEETKGTAWHEISTYALQNTMRQVYEWKDAKDTKYVIKDHKEVGEELLARILK